MRNKGVGVSGLKTALLLELFNLELELFINSGEGEAIWAVGWGQQAKAAARLIAINSDSLAKGDQLIGINLTRAAIST